MNVWRWYLIVKIQSAVSDPDVRELLINLEDVRYSTLMPSSMLKESYRLKVKFDLKTNSKYFWKTQGISVQKLNDKKWLSDLTFYVDSTGHFSALNKAVQKQNQCYIFTRIQQSFCKQAASVAIPFWKIFTIVQHYLLKNYNSLKYIGKLKDVSSEFEERFEDLY